VTAQPQFHQLYKILEIYKGGDFQLKLNNPDAGGGYWNIGQTDNAFGVGGGKLVFVPDSIAAADATVTFLNTGNVGIGTTSPDSKLDVAGHLIASSSAFGNASISEEFWVDGTASISGDLTSSGTITGSTLTDGTFSVTGGEISGATTMWLPNDFYFKPSGKTYFRLQADRINGNVLEIDSGSGVQFTDTDAEQSWLYLEPKIDQSGTANYVGLLVDVTDANEVDTGTDLNYLMDLRYDSNSMFGVTTSGNVGIGDTNPGYKLSVDGTASISDTLYVENTFTVASGSNIHSGTLYVDAATDYVGIGTTDPGYKLDIYNKQSGSIATFLQLDIDSTTDGGGAAIDFRMSGLDTADRYVARIAGVRDTDGASELRFYTDSDSALNEVMRINKAGNVGIGDTNPEYKLSVDGTASISGKLYLDDALDVA